MNAEIIAVGSELLTPFRQDTNSLYLTDKLNQLGVEVTFKTIVGDSRERIAELTRNALARSGLVILTGGLGPTEDDLSREAVADALELPLIRDPAIVEALRKRFAKRGFKFTENNAKQADIISGATVLTNRNGTAPGQWISGSYDGNEKIIILLPGPPHELKPLFEEQCMERLREKLPPAFIASRVLKVAMLGESQCDDRIASIYRRYPNVQTTILAYAGEIEIHLRARSESFQVAQQRVDKLAEKLEDELDEYVFSRQGESLEQIVGYYLQMRNATLAVAESCTGGLIGERITSVSGSSRYFAGGALVYSNELKTKFAEVPKALLAAHGAVSREVAAALAEGIRKRCGATWGLAVTGVAGPTGGTEEKPVGLVFHALSNGESTEVVERKFPGDRERVRWWASQQALDMLRRKLM
ncbi:MAG TPA: competence/damage-inducible protein A [Terriglobales bacterium]|nr:competence/damage-inducible protein A [Terriglobales bacterium]